MKALETTKNYYFKLSHLVSVEINEDGRKEIFARGCNEEGFMDGCVRTTGDGVRNIKKYV